MIANPTAAVRQKNPVDLLLILRKTELPVHPSCRAQKALLQSVQGTDKCSLRLRIVSLIQPPVSAVLSMDDFQDVLAPIKCPATNHMSGRSAKWAYTGGALIHLLPLAMGHFIP